MYLILERKLKVVLILLAYDLHFAEVQLIPNLNPTHTCCFMLSPIRFREDRPHLNSMDYQKPYVYYHNKDYFYDTVVYITGATTVNRVKPGSGARTWLSLGSDPGFV